MTLRELAVGQAAVVESVGGVHGTDEPLARRMAVLGVRPGQQVELLRRAIGGARVVAVHGGRIAIDRRTAARIQVQPVQPAGE